MKKAIVCLFLMCALCLSLLLITSCRKSADRQLEELSETELADYEGEDIDRRRISELEDAIAEYEKEIQERVQDTGQLGIYYRLLAGNFVDKKMYGPAYEQYLKALEIYPANHVLLYRTGLCRAYLAKKEASLQARERGIDEAARYYERAVELNGRYEDALYAAAVLAVYEQGDRPLALQKTRRLLERYPESVGGLFLLAGLRYQEGALEEAAALYEKIEKSSRASDAEKEQAARNRGELLERAYE